MVMVVAGGRPLRLRRDRSREAEDNDESKQNLLHAGIDANAGCGDYKYEDPCYLGEVDWVALWASSFAA